MMLKILFVKILNKINFLSILNFNVTKLFNGVSFKIPIINGIGFENLKISEPWMTDLLKKILPLSHGSFLDVGVNVGQTLIKLKALDKNIDYIGFEPNPSCVYYTSKLIIANKFLNTRLLPVGLYNDDTVLFLNLYTDQITDQAASMVTDFRPDEKIFKQIYVPVSRFESLNVLLNIKKIAFIKVDVEGAEFEVIQSMEFAIKKFRPIFLIEILPTYNQGNQLRISRQQNVESFFSENKYQILRVIKNVGGTGVEKLELIKTIEVHNNSTWCDYVIVPRELSGKFLSC